jgi:hypothetical protein
MNMEDNMNHSDLELLVMYDMYELGLDPTNPEDIKLYWKVMLPCT